MLSTQPKDFHFDQCLPCSGPAWGLNLDDLDPLGHASSWTEPLSEAAKEEVEEMPRKLQTAGGICWNNHHVGTDAKSHSRDFDILVLVKCWVFFGCFLCASGQICTGSFSERHFNLFSALHRLSHIVLYFTIGYQSMWFLKLTMMIDDVISITFQVPPCTLVKPNGFQGGRVAREEMNCWKTWQLTPMMTCQPRWCLGRFWDHCVSVVSLFFLMSGVQAWHIMGYHGNIMTSCKSSGACEPLNTIALVK